MFQVEYYSYSVGEWREVQKFTNLHDALDYCKAEVLRDWGTMYRIIIVLHTISSGGEP